MFIAKIIGIVVLALTAVIGGTIAYLDRADQAHKAEMKAGFEQMREQATHPAHLNQSMATWGRPE